MLLGSTDESAHSLFGLSLGHSSKFNRSANAIRKTNLSCNAAFTILSLHLKTCPIFSGVICLNLL
jgi:hypothetical protein